MTGKCSCATGSRCTCAAKRDSNKPISQELGLAPLNEKLPNPKRPALQSSKSENTVPGFSVRHKPRRSVASKRAQPYSIPRYHTIDVASSQAQGEHLQRPVTSSPSWPHSASSAPLIERRARSEHGSPVNHPSHRIEGLLASPLPRYDSPLSAYGEASLPPPAFNSYPGETDSTLGSAGLAAPHVDWSTFDLPYSPGHYSATYSEPPSYASYDQSTYSFPGMAMSSGDVSEVDDVPAARGSVISQPPQNQAPRSVNEPPEPVCSVGSASSVVAYAPPPLVSPSHDRFETGSLAKPQATSPEHGSPLSASAPAAVEAYRPNASYPVSTDTNVIGFQAPAPVSPPYHPYPSSPYPDSYHWPPPPISSYSPVSCAPATEAPPIPPSQWTH